MFPDEHALQGLRAFVEPLPEGPTEPSEVLRVLDEVGGPGTVATTGGRYFGFVTGSAHPVGVGAAWLTSTWDQNAAMGVMSPTAAVLDTVAGAWLATLFRSPGGSQVTFTSGTSTANIVGLAAGRDRLYHDLGWSSVDEGLGGAPPLRVVVSEAAHSSVAKALGVIGLGRSSVVTVPADKQGAMRAEGLPEPGEPTLVIAQAGNVNSGAFDPFDAIADHFEGSPHWIHVDGAFGLWAAASPARAHLTVGMERAHSWATDMHKWLNVTYDSAVAIVRDPADLARSFLVGAEYLPDSDRLEPVHRGLDMSQRARAVETWAVLKSLGREGVASLVDRTCGHAERLGAELASSGFTVHNDVVINQVLVSLDDDESTRRLIDAVAASGSIWAGGSTWRGRVVLRLSVSSWATTDDDITATVETLTSLAGV